MTKENNMKHGFLKKLLVTAAITAAVTAAATVSAAACTTIYVGGNLTEDGTPFVARTEDYGSDMNKLWFISESGHFKKDSLYLGCPEYGEFEWTFTHDSYAYTAFRDDNLETVGYECPNCGGTHAHTPYEAGGTNEMGVSVSATETLPSSDALLEVDPFLDTGIEEAEITTMILSQAASAREGVELILSIYDTAGCCDGAGIFVADDKEIWYIENTSGHQYVALKLPSSLVFSEPNLSIIGLIDLDDTENVIASANLIAVAQQAGTFVGDAEANVIDYRASYNPDQTSCPRLISALAYFNPAYDYTDAEPAYELYTLSNLDAQGGIVPLHNGIELDHAYGIADVIGYYHVAGIGSTRNLETHIFQIGGEDSKTDTVEWVAMDDASCNVFVPYYPMLTTKTYAGYQVSTDEAVFTEEEPTDADVYYPTTKSKRNEAGERVQVEGFCALPADWADSCYWTMDALSNLYEAGDLNAEEKAKIDAELADLQAQAYEVFDNIKAAVAAADTDEAKAAATAASEEMAAKVHAACVALVNEVK